MSDEGDAWCETDGDIYDEESPDLSGSWVAQSIESDPEKCEERHTKS
jgi:hypothetical protein